MTEGPGDMTVENIGVQVTRFAAANCLDEVGLMACAAVAFELLDFVAVIVLGPAAAPAAHKISLLTLNDVARRSSAVVVGSADVFLPGQASDFKEHRRRLVIKNGKLRVGRLAVVDVAEPSTNTDAPPRQGSLPEYPSAVIELVGSEIGHITVARLPEPVPGVMQFIAPQRF